MEFPFLRIPAPIKSEQKRGNPNPPKVTGPGFRRQSKRLEPAFSKLRSAINRRGDLTELRSDPSSIAPERALVFEIAEGIQNFAQEAAKLGFEYLGEFEDELEPSDDFQNSYQPARDIPEKIYLALPTEGSLRELLSLWTSYQSGNRLPHGFSSWARLFNLLVDIRPWGMKDRLPADIQEIIRSQLESAEEALSLEFEFWHSKIRIRRERFSASIRQEVQNLGGEVIEEAVVSEIKYHGMLVEFPIEVIKRLVELEEISLLQRDELMFIRPQTMSFEEPGEKDTEDLEELPEEQQNLADPICAVLDSMPIQRHKLIESWLIVDDPDDVDSMSVVSGRFHGTSMSSLVVHGDLNSDQDPIHRKIYLRPLMYSPDGQQERTLKNRLIIDLIHKAVKRIKVGDVEGEAVAPEVFIINLSMGDQSRPFSGPMSPWARLIDYLSYKYNVLFLISAGNVSSPLLISGYKTWTAFEDDAPLERHKNVLLALNDQKAYRTLLSPSESVNAITVGASNYACLPTDYVPAGMYVPLPEADAPNISSALGMGHKGAVKPDFLMPGGRELVRYSGNANGLNITPVPGNQFSGAKVASPSDAGDLNKIAFSTGTSVATALTSNLAHKIHQSLMDQEGGSLHYEMPEKYWPVVVKSLLAHTAKWPSISSDLDEIMEPRGQGSHIPRRSNLTRLFGYGTVNEKLAVECARNRATMLGYGEIGANEGRVFNIPLPQSLSGKVAFRGMTVTISWLAPTNPDHAMYKQATITVDNGTGGRDFGFDLQRKDQLQPNPFVSGKSTIVHEHFSGDRAVAIAHDDEIPIRIFCKPQAGELFTTVPYSIVVSFEVGADANIDVYNEIRQKLTVGVRQ